MKWADMPKAQRDVLILKILAGLVTVAVAVVFGVRPLMDRRARQRKALAELETRIGQAERLLQRERRIEALTGHALETLRRHLTVGLPPEENPFMWASRHVEKTAAEFGLTPKNQSPVALTVPEWIRPPDSAKPAPRAAETASTEGGGGPTAPAAAKETRFRRFGPYQVSLSIEGDFRDVVRLLAKLEAENPFCNVRSLTVMAPQNNPVDQSVQIVLEWPRHVGPFDPTLAHLVKTGSAKP